MDMLTNNSYPSRRSVVYSPHGMVATSQHLAAQAGLRALHAGGNAVDAAIATAMALTVTEPCSNGLGSDAFAILWYQGQMYGLNCSGRAPLSISIDKVRQLGYDKMPESGALPVTTPGAPGAWAALSERFGRLPLSTVAAPAIDYAKGGYPVSPIVAYQWQKTYERLYPELQKGTPGIQSWFDTFTFKGKAPKVGDMVRLPDHARSLGLIAETGARALYDGELSKKVGDFMREIGGFLSEEDLRQFKAEWIQPLSVNYRGVDVWELPPNGQGIVALMALNILKGFSFTHREDPRTYHLQLEAIKLAFADAMRYVTDPEHMKVPPEALLSEEFAAQRRALITESTALDPVPGRPLGSDTVYLCAADDEGNMISYIQSNYMGFGSGLVVPGTGIALQNRGHGFSLDAGHDNCLKGGKRTYHTIIPGFLTRQGQPIGPFGMMGGYMQPQGHVQLVMNLIDFDLNPQASIDAPRWQWQEGKKILLERGVPEHIAWALHQLGHEVDYTLDYSIFGRAQSIFRLPEGGYIGATEGRSDGTVAAW